MSDDRLNKVEPEIEWEASQVANTIFYFFKKKGKSDVIAIIENLSRTQFELVPNSSVPIHGAWNTRPVEIIGPIDALEASTSSVISGTPVVGMDMKDNKSGTRSLAVYVQKGETVSTGLVLAFYLCKYPFEKLTVGVSMSSGGWVGEMYKGQGKELVNHIEKYRTDLCQCSTSAKYCETKLDGIKISFKANWHEPFNVKFVIEDI